MGVATDFDLEVNQNRFMSTMDRELHAVLTVTARNGSGEPAAYPPDLAEVIVIDCSGSMASPPTKIAEARRATAAAIEALPDGVSFAIVEGNEQAAMVYPSRPHLARATAQTREQAKAAVTGLVAAGGTAIGTWLTLARALLAAEPLAIGHTLLLTDGKNEHETRDELESVLATCRGQFVCDARGIGDGWEPKELMRIAAALQGTADAVRQPAELTADFREIMRVALAKTVPEVRIRVGTAPWARVAFFKQVHPTIVDLAEHRVGIDEGTVEFSTGSWGDESRDYHLCLEMDAADRPMGEDLRVARIDVLVADQLRARPAAAVVHWTDDPVAFSRIDSTVSHYTAQEELSQVVIAGCDAYEAGNRQAAHAHWVRALDFARKSNNTAVMRNLRQLVEIDDEGNVRLKPNLPMIDRKIVELESPQSSSYPARGGNAAAAPEAGPGQTCHCGRISPAGANFCEGCGAEFETAEASEPAGQAAP
jgi:hypothetical protein